MTIVGSRRAGRGIPVCRRSRRTFGLRRRVQESPRQRDGDAGRETARGRRPSLLPGPGKGQRAPRRLFEPGKRREVQPPDDRRSGFRQRQGAPVGWYKVYLYTDVPGLDSRSIPSSPIRRKPPFRSRWSRTRRRAPTTSSSPRSSPSGRTHGDSRGGPTARPVAFPHRMM